MEDERLEETLNETTDETSDEMLNETSEAQVEDKKPAVPKKKPESVTDYNLIWFLTKAGHVVILTMLWLVSVALVVTAAAGTSAFYYAMIKNVRKDRGYPVKEFFSCFKRTLMKGIAVMAILVAWFFGLYYMSTVAISWENSTGTTMYHIYIVLAVISVCICLYLFPVMSRFELPISKWILLSFVMSIRFVLYTVIMAGIALGLGYLYIFYLPLPMAFVLPGAVVFLFTYMIEQALRKYTPAPTGDEDAWYYE